MSHLTYRRVKKGFMGIVAWSSILNKPSIITGLDIGSSKISAVSAQADKQGTFRILGQATVPSKGVSRGIITDLSGAVDSVSKAMSRLKEKVSARPGDLYVNISAHTVKAARSRGMIPLTLRGREIAIADIDRCVDVASTIHLPFDREIIHKIVHSFSADDHPWIKDPLGLYASRLSCEALIITAEVNHIQNIYKCVNSAGYDVREIVFTGIADGAGLMDGDDKEAGVILLDMGASLSEVSVFFDGALRDMDIIPIGAQDISGGFSQSPEFDSLLSRIKERRERFLATGGKIGSMILTGGMGFTDGVAEYLEEKLLYPVKMGVAKAIRGNISGLDSMRLSTALGLCKYGYWKHETKTREDRRVIKRLHTKVVDIFNNYF